MFAARLLGVPEHQVRVITRDVGGGFGEKVVPLREDMCVLLAARALATGTGPAVIKWIEDRQENLQAAGQARHEHGVARPDLHGSAGYRKKVGAAMVARAVQRAIQEAVNG